MLLLYMDIRLSITYNQKKEISQKRMVQRITPGDRRRVKISVWDGMSDEDFKQIYRNLFTEKK